MQPYIEIAKSVLKEEALRYVLMALLLFILYQTLIRKYILSAIKEITTFSSKIEKIDKIDKLDKLCEDVEVMKDAMVDTTYDELAKKVSKAKQIGGKTHQQDEKFKKRWDRYIALGDGYGDGLLKDWDSLEWITEEEFFAKLKEIKGNE